MKIIISRYNENIDWSKEFNNVTIYNKGEKMNIENEILLENVGREGHTYFRYIYDNYENLEQNTVFLQGYPFDHSPNIIETLRRFTKTESDNKGFQPISEREHDTTSHYCRLHPGIPMKSVYKSLFGNDDFKDLKFNSGAQFMVSRETIHKRSKEYYLNIIKLLDYDINPIEGYVIERLHRYIFS